jgi:ferric-dicitrate binding protein FerR (iron transport regulator)
MNDEINELIARKLSGDITADEETTLDKWRNSSAEHAATFDAHEQQWKEIDQMIGGVHFDAAQAWEQVAAQTVKKENGRKRMVIPFKKMALSLAAVLLVGIVIYRLTIVDSMEVVLADNGNREVVLPDDTHVTLHAGSTLSYAGRFSGKERTVKLDGEAYFEVAKDASRPFVIHAHAADVRVLGTAFNLRCTDNTASVMVTEGRVRFMSGADSNTYSVLTAGDQAVISDNVISRSQYQDMNLLYWKTGQISYNKSELTYIARQLSEIFSNEIVLDSSFHPGQLQQQLTMSFKNQKIEQILSEICLITDSRWTGGADKGYRIMPK